MYFDQPFHLGCGSFLCLCQCVYGTIHDITTTAAQPPLGPEIPTVSLQRAEVQLPDPRQLSPFRRARSECLGESRVLSSEKNSAFGAESSTVLAPHAT